MALLGTADVLRPQHDRAPLPARHPVQVKAPDRHQMRPSRWPAATASRRLVTPSLAKRERSWVLTVLGDTERAWASSGTVSMDGRSCRRLSSRAVSTGALEVPREPADRCCPTASVPAVR